MNTLILGGAKSGKSLFAETLAIQSGKKLVYIATAQAGDNEMKQRILLHQQRRAEQNVVWLNIEEPTALSKVIKQYSTNNRLILIDCLTLWLSNLLFSLNEKQRQMEIDALLECLPSCQADMFFVSNETGLGIVPMNQLSRQFIDLSGSLHQQIAQVSDRVIMTIAGLPLVLKGSL
ncbi:MAG TPA: bifunctional adenosylcobinamide kinase/adenosylcobinamide-phosphate guanylyltransferase [Leucothrix mucor]|nr:bifunctional adenosylcobinamide kinase/adenosylcobinamide-phosphate guanylyltransferase [Leucothrix mucor]